MTKQQFWASDDGSVIDWEPSGAGWREVSKAEGDRIQKETACRHLRAWLKPNDTVYTVLRHVVRGGMSRRISLLMPYVDDRGARIVNISGWAARACGFRLAPNELSLAMSGAGMDMGFEAVYGLGLALWPEGTPEPHGRRNGEPDSAGGYALKHEWL